MKRKLLFLTLLFSGARLTAQDLDLGASIRGYGFYSLEDSPLQARRDSEFVVFRLTPELSLTPNIELETHLLVDLISPPVTPAATIATGSTRTYLDLERRVLNRDNVHSNIAFDRLNAQINTGAFELVVGRQAITWGVNYFWPALDLFAPFTPGRIDRDYKPGVDAARLIVPIGAYSEVQVVGAILGDSISEDGALGGLIRLNMGTVDFGFMGGTFHEDKVAGAFVTANVAGTGIRGEVSWTQSGDPRDEGIGRGVFWRGSLGVDRQLTPTLTLLIETAWNQYGATDPEEYLLFVNSDRLLRGEINALGRYHSGASLTWRFHPLWNFGSIVLLGWDDSSALWIPSLVWSTGNNSEMLFGAQLGFGKEPTSVGLPQSEYGSLPHTIFAAFKIYL
ncbi:MAG TPA: hypothetical protein PLP42_14120 [Acidobacteriota bacterium]|nr:hypothetical protein [Acidobacteriota bacterium]